MTSSQDTMGVIRANLGKTSQIQVLLRTFEAKDRSIAERNFERVNFWSTFNIVVMLVVFVLQVFSVRHMFSDNRKTRTWSCRFSEDVLSSEFEITAKIANFPVTNRCLNCKWHSHHQNIDKWKVYHHLFVCSRQMEYYLLKMLICYVKSSFYFQISVLENCTITIQPWSLVTHLVSLYSRTIQGFGDPSIRFHSVIFCTVCLEGNLIYSTIFTWVVGMYICNHTFIIE